MATTTGSIVFYDPAIENIVEGAINLGDTSPDGFGVMLTPSSHVPSVLDEFVDNSDTHSPSDDEVTGNGYGRVSLTSVSSSQTGGAYTFDANNPVWTASGGTITARYYHLYYDNGEVDTAKELICYGLLDTTPADVSATDANTITLQWNASGIFTGSFTDA